MQKGKAQKYGFFWRLAFGKAEKVLGLGAWATDFVLLENGLEKFFYGKPSGKFMCSDFFPKIAR